MLLSVFASGAQVDLFLIAISLILLIGYVSEVAFRITRIPESLILILIGILLGSVFHLLPTAYINTLRTLTPLFGDLALIMIMFNGGRIIRLSKKIFSNTTGYALAFTDIVLAGAVLSVFMRFAFGWPFLYGGMLGVILGETSTIVILPFIKRVKLSAEFYQTIMIETTFNSVFSILFFYLLLVPISGTALSIPSFLGYSVSYLLFAVVIGTAAGFTWLLMQSIFKGANGYITTLAVAILLYGFASFINAAAVVSVLIYAIIIGNPGTIKKYLKMPKARNEERYNKSVEHEMEFLVRTFFFVLLGLIAIISFYYFLFALAITIILVFARKIEVEGLLRKMKREDRNIIFSLMPRGLAVAVLSSIFYATGYPYSGQIFYISFMVLVLTNLLFTVTTMGTTKKLVKQLGR